MPFNPAAIRIDTPPLTVFQVLRKIERGNIELNPDFQRNFVWKETRQSRLIESILLKIPLPTFYLDASNESRWQVVDGLQRLSTLYAFCKTQHLRLSSLEYLTHLNGKHFDDLPNDMQQTIEDTPLTLIAVQHGTPRDVKFMIFRRINTGGINLNEQEIRHAMFGNPARDFLGELAQSSAFRAATGGRASPERMDDRECVLRFLAFRLNPYDTALLDNEATPSFDYLLNQTMDDLNKSTFVRREQYAEDFRESMLKAHEIFGDLAFREVRDLYEAGPFRKALFEAWSVLLSGYSLKDVVPPDNPRRRDALLKASIEQMSNNTAFIAAIQPGSDDRQSILTRFSTIAAMLREIVQ